MNAYYHNQLVQSVLSFSELALKTESTRLTEVRREIALHMKDSAQKDLEDIESKVKRK